MAAREETNIEQPYMPILFSFPLKNLRDYAKWLTVQIVCL